MRRRSGFTLVELLVAMALIVFMMLILSEAFAVGLDSFRRLKAIGDMNARLRTAAQLLRRDLQADHFEGKKRVSSATFWTPGPPREGFFRIWQGSQPTGPQPATGQRNFNEGNDGFGNPSTRATDHMLHFTVKLRGNDRHDFLTARVPTNPPSPLLTLGRTDSRYQEPGTDSFNSQWFEVAYFLRRNGNTAGATPLYALYRRQKLVVPESLDLRELNWGNRQVSVSGQNSYLEVSCKPNPQTGFTGSLYFNTPTDLTVPQRRFGLEASSLTGPTATTTGMPTVRQPTGFDTQIDPNDSRTWTYPTLGEEDPAQEGNDLLLPDVLSFEVQISTGAAFSNLASSTTNDLYRDVPASGGNPARPRPHVWDSWSDVVDGAYNYDRWSITALPRTGDHLPLSNTIQAIRITIRVWDVKTLQSRQLTIIQDM